MSRRLCVGVTFVIVASLTCLTGPASPAGAEPVAPREQVSTQRFRQLDLKRFGRLRNLPQGLQPDKTVNALVQLSTDPVAVQEVKDPQSFDLGSARHRVRANQDSALPRLAAVGARPYGRLTTVLNAVQVRVKVRDLAGLAAVPGVKRVQVSSQVRPANGKAARYTGVDRTWQDLGLTGKGQTIGTIDTGIDYTHADFGGAGTTAAYRANNRDVVERGSFPTAKVTGGFDFVGDDYDGASSGSAAVPNPDDDPLDCEGHGTHVAGTAAGQGVTSTGRPYVGPYRRATLSRAFAVHPGVAPRAKLRAYKVFGCEGSASSDIIVAAIDRAAADGVDVLNISLGSAFGTAQDLETEAIEAATRAGVLVVVAGGNSGHGAYLVASPATSDAALAVAAVDAQATRLPAATVSGAVSGTAVIANGARLATAVSGALVNVGLGCRASDYARAQGKIAVTVRGTCDRSDRAVLGQQAGAKAVILINTEPGWPPVEGPIAGVSIPLLGVSAASGPDYLAADGQQVTLTRRASIANPGYGRASDFSSNGPRRLDSAQKPDVAAPGTSIPSAAVGTGRGGVALSGTSMASPHVAGVGALVRQRNTRWSPRQVKSAIMSTASPAKVKGFDSQQVGTGLVQPRLATVTSAYLGTKTGRNSLRFGAPQLAGAFRRTERFTLTNRSRRSVTYTMSTRFSGKRMGASVSVSPRVVTVPAGRSRTLSVRMRLSRADVARLPGASAADGGRLPTIRGLVVASPRRPRAGVVPLRIAFLAVPVPLSNVQATAAVTATGRGASATGSIPVTNTGVHAGTAEVYAWLLSDAAGDAEPEVADLTDLGVQAVAGTAVGAGAQDKLLVFAAAQGRGTSTQATRQVELYLDTNRDGQIDFVTLSLDTGLFVNGEPDGTVTSFTVDLTTFEIVDAWSAIAPANGSTVELPVLASRIGATSTSGPVAITAAGFSTVSNADGDGMPGAARFDAYAPVVSQGNRVALAPGQSGRIAVRVDRNQLTRQTHAGWLVVALDDRAGRAEADRVRLTLSPSRTSDVRLLPNR